MHFSRCFSLLVISPADGDEAPAIRRTYRWVANGRLECRVDWIETEPAGRQAIQIFQIERGATVEAQALPTPSAPRGYVLLPLADRPSVIRTFDPPSHVQRLGRRVRLRRASTEEKFGFAEQPLVARWSDTELILRPGPVRGQVVDDPNEGYPTQVYLGADAWPLLEIEQLSPRLRPGRPGSSVGHTVTLALHHLAAD